MGVAAVEWYTELDRLELLDRSSESGGLDTSSTSGTSLVGICGDSVIESLNLSSNRTVSVFPLDLAVVAVDWSWLKYRTWHSSLNITVGLRGTSPLMGVGSSSLDMDIVELFNMLFFGTIEAGRGGRSLLCEWRRW